MKLSTVRKFYSHCLEHLNAEFCTVNSTRLKENILNLNSNLEESNLKKEVYISYKDDLAAALRFSRENPFESDATHLSRAANILRKDIASVKQKTFTGYFNEKPQVDSDFQLKTAKHNVALFSRLFIACQARGGDLEVFFSHEKQTAPPSLSDKGELRPAKTKSGIIECLLNTEHEHCCETPSVDAKIFDGPCIVNMLRPTECRTFSEYAANVFLPYVELQLRSVRRVDLVWDRYFSDSLKGITGNSRGVGVRKKNYSEWFITAELDHISSVQ